MAWILALLVMAGCNKQLPIINESDTYAICNDLLVACSGHQPGTYCLFGYKWGPEASGIVPGLESTGPQVAGGTLTYSFQEKNGTLSTHRQVDIPSESWDEILDCAQENIREAFTEWSSVTNVSFQELSINSEADIKIYVAATVQSAVAFPNYEEAPCDALSGVMVFDANSREKSCSAFYINALHEIGHVLGLGHVNTGQVMASDRSKFSYRGLQPGDIAGARQLYGEK